MSKKNRLKVIGDPLKRFKQPPAEQVCPPEMRRVLEQIMEEDHRAGKPLRVAIMTSPNGLPDRWFFDKARALGYKFDDEFEWWSEQCAKVFASKADLPPYDVNKSLARLEGKSRRRMGDQEFEETIIEEHGSIEQWRDYVRKTLIDAHDQATAAAQKLLVKQRARQH